MTALDFFNSLAFPALINLAVGFLVFGIAVHAGARAIGVKEGFSKALAVSLVVSIFSLIRSIVFLDTFFIAIILGAIALVSVTKVYGLQPVQALYVLLVAVIVFIVLQTVLVPIVVGSLAF